MGCDDFVIKYLECLRADHPRLGNGVLDGCKKFVPCGDEEDSLGSVFCATCSCNRKHHRMIEVPVLHLGITFAGESEEGKTLAPAKEEKESRHGKRSCRTKLTADQKEKLATYAEAVDWKPHWKSDDGEIRRLCSEVGISRDVFKNWISNNRKRQRSKTVGQTSKFGN